MIELTSVTNNSNPYQYIVSEKEFSHKRSFFKKLWDKIVATAREIFYGLLILFRRLKYCFTSRSEYIKPDSKISWKKGNNGLFLMIHGLDDHPSIWESHINDLLKKKLNIEIRAPYVPRKGNCSLECAAKAITNIVIDYTKKNPGKPICILGVSNGARIASYIDISLRQYPVVLKISTIAGPHFGSKKMNFLKKIPLINRLFCKQLKDELSYGSTKSKEIIEQLRKKVTTGKRSYDFYSTSEDYLVTPYFSALPIIHQEEKHYIVHGEGHGSIVWRVKKHQITRCVSWIKGCQEQA